MSELEIQRRQEYKRNRKKWTLIQLTAIILLAIISLGLFIGYNRMNQTHYIEYKEAGSVNYKVHYKDNAFFEDEWIDMNQSYISSLTDGIKANFNYALGTGSSDMSFDYNYSINAKLVISKKDVGTPYYTYEEIILPTTEAAVNGSSIKVNETVSIDYKKFDTIARNFITTYNLKNATAVLVISLNIGTSTGNANFDQKIQNSYFTSLNIPLAEDNFNISRTSSATENESKLFEFNSRANRDVLLVLAIIAACLSAAIAILLLIFLKLTKNEDVTYASAVNKILKSYDSFIQRINGEFDCEGYQIVEIKTFNEMLGIRDTIQSPILMSENRDETMTKFLIPTNTKILYTFIIKVENYDEIYSRVVEEPVVEEPVEEIVILEEVNEEDLSEAMAQPELNLDEIEIIPDDDDQFEVAPEEPGIEVVGVVWPEKKKKNKIYRYDPNGEILNEGDVVLVPTWNNAQQREVIRKATVAHANHRVEPEHIKHPLKKIIAVIKRSIHSSLTPVANEAAKQVEEIYK